MINSVCDSEGFIISDRKTITIWWLENDMIAWIAWGNLTLNEVLTKMWIPDHWWVSKKIIQVGTNPQHTNHITNTLEVLPDSENSDFKEDFFWVFRTIARGNEERISQICAANLPHPEEGKFWFEKIKTGHVHYFTIKNWVKYLISQCVIFQNRTTKKISISLYWWKIWDIILIDNIHSHDLPQNIWWYIDVGIESITKGTGTIIDMTKNITEAIQKFQNSQSTSATWRIDWVSYTVHSLKDERHFDLDITINLETLRLVDVCIVEDKKWYTVWLWVSSWDTWIDNFFAQRYIGKSKNQVEALRAFIRKIKVLLEGKNPNHNKYRDFLRSFKTGDQIKRDDNSISLNNILFR